MRDSIVRGPLQPMALDILSPPAAKRFGLNGYIMALRAGGSANVLNRYSRELAATEDLRGREDADLWLRVREFSSDFVRRQPGGIILRISTTLKDVHGLFKAVSGSCISRASSGVSYVYVTNWNSVLPIWKAGREKGWGVAVEFAPEDVRSTKELWLHSSGDASAEAFGMMERVKRMFDPGQLLNRSRLYGRI
jgi:hypothetical protein